MTCLGCGETFAAGGQCVVCCTDKHGKPRKVKPPAVLTVSYLSDEEYVLI